MKHLLLLLLVVLHSLAFTACGGGEGSTPSSTADAGSQTSGAMDAVHTDTATPDAAADAAPSTDTGAADTALPMDTSATDTSGADTASPTDTSMADTAPPMDTSMADTSMADTGTMDTGADAASPMDTSTADTTPRMDTGMADTSMADTTTMDTSATDTAPPMDTSTADTAMDTTTMDTSAADTAPMDTMADVPNQAPTVVVTAPTEGAAFQADEAIAVAFTVDDDQDAPDALTVTLTSDQDGALAIQGPDAAGSVTATLTGLSLGTHTLTASAIDGDGLETTSARTVTVERALGEAVVTIAFEGEAPGTRSGLTASVTVAGEAPPNDAEVAWAWSRDGEDVGNATPTVLSDATARGERWEVSVAVTTIDAVYQGSGAVTIVNTPPRVDRVRLSPISVQDARVPCDAVVSDDDGDPVVSRYRFTITRAGADPIVVDTDLNMSLTPGLDVELMAGDVVTCTVTPSDDADPGAPLTSAPMTVFACDRGAFAGDFAGEPIELAGYTEVQGSVTLEGHSGRDLNALACLTRVSSILTIRGNPNLESVRGLNALREVGLDVIIDDNPALIDLSGFELIDLIGRSLFIRNNDALERIELAFLFIMELASLDIRGNARLVEVVSLQNLMTVNDNLGLRDNPLLTRVMLDGLTYIEFTLTINNNTSLRHINGLSTLQYAGLIQILNNPALQSVDGLASLTTVGDQFRIASNAALEHLDGLQSLAEVGGEVVIRNNVGLRDVAGLGGLMSMGSLNISGNTTLCQELVDLLILELTERVPEPFVVSDTSGNSGACTGDGCTQGAFAGDYTGDPAGLTGYTEVQGSVTINNQPITDLAALACLNSVTGALTLTQNAALTDLSGLAALTEVGGPVRVADNAALCQDDVDAFIAALSMTSPNLDVQDTSNNTGECVAQPCSLGVYPGDFTGHPEALRDYTGVEGDVTIEAQPIMNLADLACLTTIGGDLTLRDNPDLGDSFGLSSLIEVGRDVTLSGNGVLTDLIGFERLERVGRHITIADNEALFEVSIGFMNVTQLPGDLTIRDNPNLIFIELLRLETARGLVLRNNPMLMEVVFGNLREVTGSFSVLENASLSGVGQFPILDTVDFVTVVGNATLQSLDALSSVTTIDGALDLRGNGALQNLDGLTSVTALNGDLIIHSNGSLANIDSLSNLQTIGDLMAVYNNAALCQDDVDALVAALSALNPALEVGDTTNNNGACP